MNDLTPKALNTKYEINRVAIKLFFAIGDEWGLTEEQRCTLVGITSRATLRNWRNKLDDKKPFNLNNNTLERLSYIAGIYKGLQLLFSDSDQWKTWVRKPNKDFGGTSVLERMLAGRMVDLVDVRRYIDGFCGGSSSVSILLM